MNQLVSLVKDHRRLEENLLLIGKQDRKMKIIYKIKMQIFLEEKCFPMAKLSSILPPRTGCVDSLIIKLPCTYSK